MADGAVMVSNHDAFRSAKSNMNGQLLTEHKSEELQAERKKRKAAEKEASRWRKKAAELQALTQELQQQEQKQKQQQQQQEQQQHKASEQTEAEAHVSRPSDEEYVKHLVKLIVARVTAKKEALGQVVEEGKLLAERAAREARMEEAIVRARMRLEHEERTSWPARLEQAALAAGFVGLGALAAYITVRAVQSSSAAPSDHNWRTGTDTASLTQAAVAASSAPMETILRAAPSPEAYQLGSLISTADVLKQKASASSALHDVPAASVAAAAVAAAVQRSDAMQRPAVHAAADVLAQRRGQRGEGMLGGSPFGVVAASSVREAASPLGGFLRVLGSLVEHCW